MSNLFTPVGKKDLRKLYPELSRIEEFKPLSPVEMLFVWYFASPSSPYRDPENKITDRERIEESVADSFGDNMDEEMMIKYRNNAFPEKIKLAIDRMKAFDMSVRDQAKRMVATILGNFSKMVEVDEKSFEHNETSDKGKTITVVDWQSKNSYVSLCAKISDQLPLLIKQVEEGFGVVDEKGKESSGTKAIDRFHQSNR
jgi:hypothetical protein